MTAEEILDGYEEMLERIDKLRSDLTKAEASVHEHKAELRTMTEALKGYTALNRDLRAENEALTKRVAKMTEALEIIASCPTNAVHLMPLAAQAGLSEDTKETGR